MTCGKCNSDNVKTVDSRRRADGTRRRRYECRNCGNRFPTVELPAEDLKKILDLLKQETIIRETATKLNDEMGKLLKKED